jgi:NAD+ synthase (glutamine-hydrolysing)
MKNSTRVIQRRFASIFSKIDPSRLLHTGFMGSVNSSPETRRRAGELAKFVGCYHIDCSIDSVIDSFLSVFFAAMNFAPIFKLYGGTNQENLALQNLQARIRMVFSYLFAQLIPVCRNRMGSLLVLSCGNVDECLRGYLTKYDCSSGDLNPIGGISKIDLQSFVRFMKAKLELSLLDE